MGLGGTQGVGIEGYCCLAELAIWEELRVRVWVSAVGVWGTRWGDLGVKGLGVCTGGLGTGS